MPMGNEELTDTVLELRDAFHILAAGCQELAGAVGNQTRLLMEIKETVTAEPTGPNPIIQLLQTLVELSEANAAVLDRIEKATAR